MSDEERQLSEKDLDQQENLTPERLRLLDGPAYLTGNRPQNSLSELMHWTQHEFGNALKGVGRCSIYIHNKITIDGAFLQFCEEEGISVECLFKDAVTSWKTRYNTEHFMAMGVFKISKDNLLFLHAALFHKGNQNEDEVSFFVIVPDGLFYEYVSLRNRFDEWEKKRDRGNLEIEVVGGNSIPYTRDLKWDDLFLEELPKGQLISAVEGFLASKDIYLKRKVPWKKGIVLWGNRGCGKTTALKIMMSVYKDLKPVTVQPGHHAMDEVVEEAFQYAIEHAPSLLYFEDLQELMHDIDTSHFLQLLDGVEGRDGLLIVATGNDFSSLEDNIMSRPRRFDKKIEFPLPNRDMSKLYLRKWFGTTLSGERYDEIVAKTVRKKFTYAHLQEIYFSSVYIALKNDREDPVEDDILKALDEVIIEKRSSDGGLIAQPERRDITDYQGFE
jgi:energy-coupling factor transporter ATP-binding protein EcfA2